MKFDNELIKDFIIEKDPTVKRKDIIFENVSFELQINFLLYMYTIFVVF